MGTGVPLYFHQGTTRTSGLGDTYDLVEKITGHCIKDGVMQFKVVWKGEFGEESWEPAMSFIQEWSPKWLSYVTQEGLEKDFSKIFQQK